MASNTRPAYDLGPSFSVDGGASIFTTGEYVLVRISEIQVEGYVDNEATAVGTDLPPSSNGSSPQHFAFIHQVNLLPDSSCMLEVYPVLSFASSGGAVPAYNGLTDAAKATLLPLPPLSSRHPTPEAFGAPLDFGNWSTSRDSFLHVIPKRFIIPTRRLFKRVNPPLIMPFSVLSRIDRYREYLGSYTQTTITLNHDDQSHSLPNGGSGDEQGSSNPRYGQTGDGERKAASGVTLEQFSVKSSQGLLVLEGVDEDAEDADATTLDELIMLAHDNPIWREELRKYLQEEEKEREQMQKERAVRLARWQEDIAIQPT